MNIRRKIKENVVLEVIKWVGLVLLLIVPVVMNYMYYDYDILVRKIVIFFVIIGVLCILCTTKLIRLLIVFGKEAYVELKRVVWPTYQDALNITAVVVAVTVVISIILWGLDAVLVRVISFGLRL